MPGTKIISLSNLKRKIKVLKQKNKRIVFTNGCFDILHFGHIKYLQDAKNKGDYLIVAVNSDASIKKIKAKKQPKQFRTPHKRSTDNDAERVVSYNWLFQRFLSVLDLEVGEHSFLFNSMRCITKKFGWIGF